MCGGPPERETQGSEGQGRGPRDFGGEGRGSCSFGKVNKEDHVVLECSFLSCSLGSRRDFARKKRGEKTLAGGP